jgi:hypothetical protein
MMGVVVRVGGGAGGLGGSVPWFVVVVFWNAQFAFCVGGDCCLLLVVGRQFIVVVVVVDDCDSAHSFAAGKPSLVEELGT